MFLEGPKELFWADECAWREAAEARRPPLKSTHAGSGWCFSHTAKGSYFSALLCALERSGCEDAFEQKDAKLTKSVAGSALKY